MTCHIGSKMVAMVTVPPESLRLDMMDPIQLMLSDEPPNSSCSATKKIPKLFNVPITNTFTWKKHQQIQLISAQYRSPQFYHGKEALNQSL